MSNRRFIAATIAHPKHIETWQPRKTKSHRGGLRVLVTRLPVRCFFKHRWKYPHDSKATGRRVREAFEARGHAAAEHMTPECDIKEDNTKLCRARRESEEREGGGERADQHTLRMPRLASRSFGAKRRKRRAYCTHKAVSRGCYPFRLSHPTLTFSAVAATRMSPFPASGPCRRTAGRERAANSREASGPAKGAKAATIAPTQRSAFGNMTNRIEMDRN